MILQPEEVIKRLPSAFANEEFVVYYQPQYKHSTGRLVGSEALVRWVSPTHGVIPPLDFIPILEEKKLIPELDVYVFEHVCQFLRRSLDSKLFVVRISVNLSRCDVADPLFTLRLETIRQKYNIPTELIHVEITETAIVHGAKTVSDSVDRLHSFNYKVEMDDFGSGYSSLNVLKDIHFDVLKLDLKFIQGAVADSRGGTILSSIVRMAKWLKLPVIAEGVETMEQADFLRSIGCDCVQGYLYSKPIPEQEYVNLLNNVGVDSPLAQSDLLEMLNANKFWSPDSLETLVFNNFAGAAAIIDYHGGLVEVLRVNQKYQRELGENQSEQDLFKLNPLLTMSEENREIYLQTLEKVIADRSEQECETWRDLNSYGRGSKRVCIRSSIQLIGESAISRLFYVMIRNITAEKQRYEDLVASERKFRMASELANIYSWEYIVETKEMFPCIRCMRDFGLSSHLQNYPESVIESGLFPQDYADMFRDWHRQISAGVKSLDAVITLTEKRIPFRIRYITEFDVSGKPVKAFGSAAECFE